MSSPTLDTTRLARVALALALGACGRVGYDPVSGEVAVADASPAVDAGPEPRDAASTADPDTGATGRWLDRGLPRYSAGGATATVLGGRLHYLGGGSTWEGTQVFRDHDVYDPATGAWSSAPADTPDDYIWGAQAHAYRGRLYLVGGWPRGGKRLRVYDPAANSWQRLADGPGDFQYGFVSAVVGDALYVFGGYPARDVDAPSFKFDLVSQAWSPIASLPENKGSGSLAGTAVGTKIYVLNGDAAGGSTTLRSYDTLTDTWSLGPALDHHLEGAAAVAAGDKLYFFGGALDHDGGAPVAVRASVTIYDTTARAWSSGRDMSPALMFSAAAALGGEIHVVGGLGADERAVSFHATYAP
jgi:N-acetylneuraminic acid mutarotase